jgi:Uma2 family endonuclease
MVTLPHHHDITAEEFAALPRQGLRTELVRGEIVTMLPAFTDHGETAMRLSIILGHYVLEHDLGKMYTAETGFLIARNPDTIRAPDLAFIQKSRLTPDASGPHWGQIVPDLVAEVASTYDRAAEIADKVQMWLDAGVQVIWVLYPMARAIEIYRPGQAVRTLDDQATLDGGTLIAGFSAPVARIFG